MANGMPLVLPLAIALLIANRLTYHLSTMPLPRLVCGVWHTWWAVVPVVVVVVVCGCDSRAWWWRQRGRWGGGTSTSCQTSGTRGGGSLNCSLRLAARGRARGSWFAGSWLKHTNTSTSTSTNSR